MHATGIYVLPKHGISKQIAGTAPLVCDPYIPRDETPPPPSPLSHRPRFPCCAMLSQEAVSAYFTSKQILPFGLAEQSCPRSFPFSSHNFAAFTPSLTL